MNLNEIQSVRGNDKRDISSPLIVSNKVILTKGDKMSFGMLEDLQGKLVYHFSKVFAEYEHLLSQDDPVVMTGYVNLSESPESFSTKDSKIKNETENRVSGVKLI